MQRKNTAAACFTLEEIRHAVSTYKHKYDIYRRRAALLALKQILQMSITSLQTMMRLAERRDTTLRGSIQYYMCPYPKLHKTESANFHSVKTEQRAAPTQ